MHWKVKYTFSFPAAFFLPRTFPTTFRSRGVRSGTSTAGAGSSDRTANTSPVRSITKRRSFMRRSIQCIFSEKSGRSTPLVTIAATIFSSSLFAGKKRKSKSYPAIERKTLGLANNSRGVNHAAERQGDGDYRSGPWNRQGLRPEVRPRGSAGGHRRHRRKVGRGRGQGAVRFQPCRLGAGAGGQELRERRRVG